MCDRNQPVARIVPLARSKENDEELLVLASQGKLRLGEGVVEESFWEMASPCVPAAARSNRSAVKTKSGRKQRPPITAFLDTSPLVPLCCFQSQSAQAKQAPRTYSRQVVCWGTVIEAVSSLNRLTREGTLTVDGSKQAFARLDYLRSRWNEVQPTEEVRERAECLLRIHKLRAADALQLAAALVWLRGPPAGTGADRRRWKSLGGRWRRRVDGVPLNHFPWLKAATQRLPHRVVC